MNRFMLAVAGSLLPAVPCPAGVYNLKVVTDANPDYSEMDSMVRSAWRSIGPLMPTNSAAPSRWAAA